MKRTRGAGSRLRHLERVRFAMLAVGVLATVAGGWLLAAPVIGADRRGHADQQAVRIWQQTAKPLAADAAHNRCGSNADYALVTFVEPADHHYAGVAGDGTWDRLQTRAMVHYTGTAAPGERGNVVIAFHREPDYEFIDQLGVGGTVRIQDRSCRVFSYLVTQRWAETPEQITQLAPTDGHELTLVTCDPWWQDTHRLVWRAELVGPAAASGGGRAAGTPASPAF